jgi:predicted deacylase
METIDRGSAGSARVAIVGGIHGDEPAGERIVRRLADEPDEEGAGSGCVRLIVANEPALAAGTRYTDVDLNRVFPGDPDSEEYERALAPRLAAELEGMDAVLALHTSHSAPPPFAIFSDPTESVRRSVTGMPVEYVVDSGGLRSTTLDSVVPHTVSIEVGRQGSEEAVEFGYEACLAFLRADGATDDEPAAFTETTVVAGDKEVPKGGGDPAVYFDNFEEIPVGEVFAEDDEYTHRVEEEGVVPILASEHGYEEIFGIYGRVRGVMEPPASDGEGAIARDGSAEEESAEETAE